MPKMSPRNARRIGLGEALAEKEEDDSVCCRTCTAPAADEFAPYCMSCGIYWQDVSNGLFDERPGDGPISQRLVTCEPCAGTGHIDRVGRGFWAPGDCHPCSGSGWVNPETGRRFGIAA